MKGRLHRLPALPPPHDDHLANHTILTFAEFAEELGINRSTIYKWKNYHPEKFPKHSLLKNPSGEWCVDTYYYRKGYTVVN